eukprot:2943021-Rhodomonas_salina.1
MARGAWHVLVTKQAVCQTHAELHIPLVRAHLSKQRLDRARTLSVAHRLCRLSEHVKHHPGGRCVAAGSHVVLMSSDGPQVDVELPVHAAALEEAWMHIEQHLHGIPQDADVLRLSRVPCQRVHPLVHVMPVHTITRHSKICIQFALHFPNAQSFVARERRVCTTQCRSSALRHRHRPRARCTKYGMDCCNKTSGCCENVSSILRISATVASQRNKAEHTPGVDPKVSTLRGSM